MFDLTLSFDNGPEPTVTPLVLDTLARHGIKASFFVLGMKLAMPEGRALAERAHREGHWLGNHTWSHAIPLGLRKSEAQVAEEEIGRTQETLGTLAHPDRFFRPFGGGNLDQRLLSPAVLDYLAAGKFTLVLWNAIPRDWEDPAGWAARALQQCASRPWTLVVLHDLPTGAMDDLDRFIAQAKDAGARFRQGFPPSCLPLRRGVVAADMAPYVNRGALALSE